MVPPDAADKNAPLSHQRAYTELDGAGKAGSKESFLVHAHVFIVFGTDGYTVLFRARITALA